MTIRKETQPDSAPLNDNWLIVCFACRLDTAGYPDTAEAGYLAGVHNDLHHGSRPEASIAPVATYQRPPFMAGGTGGMGSGSREGAL